MKRNNSLIFKLFNFYIAVAALLLTACSDVEYEAANYSEAVTNLVAEYTEGSRQVTLRWDNPSMSGQSGIQIIKDNLYLK